jgi:uncharacterized protein YifE (UPF0438 family)
LTFGYPQGLQELQDFALGAVEILERVGQNLFALPASDNLENSVADAA